MNTQKHHGQNSPKRVKYFLSDYIITDSIHIGDDEFVLGVNQHSPNNFVTWRCDGGNNYYWGHYYSDLFSAQKDLLERASEKVCDMQSILDEKKAMEPKLSPWGEVQTCTELCHGVYFVSTAGHGGIMARVNIAERVFSEAAQKCSFTDGNHICFEEDCDAPVAIRELLDTPLMMIAISQLNGCAMIVRNRLQKRHTFCFELRFPVESETQPVISAGWLPAWR